MFQQIIALLIIVYFILKLLWQKKQNKISRNEFIFWLVFWLLSSVIILFLKQIDRLVLSLGFSGSGIEVLLYLSIAWLFYLIFRLRIKMERIDRNITKIIRGISLKDK